MNEPKVVNWDELVAILNDTTRKPDDMAWSIYHYMKMRVSLPDSKHNEGVTQTETLSSDVAQKLMECYTKLPIQRPSLIHSLMVSIAIKMSQVYADFHFITFLNTWGLSNLREEDKQPQKDKSGKVYPSLLEKLTKAYLAYRLRNRQETMETGLRTLINAEATRLKFKPVVSMVAVKIFESVRDGRKIRTVKLVGPQGDEMMTDWHVFGQKPWDIAGRMFDVMMRESEAGTLRVEYAAPSVREVADVYGRVVGFVDGYDKTHDHLHIYDAQSRHFVAESSKVHPGVGEFIYFCPIIPKVDKFKSAIIVEQLDKYQGRELFGTKGAKVLFVNTEKEYLKYASEDGVEGFCHLDRCVSGVKQGDEVRIITFLKRGMDGTKRPYAASIF